MKQKPNLREAQKFSTHERLLEAARDVFHREGYYAATVDQIVSAAGASRQTFYVHFADKGQLLTELIAGYTERAEAYMDRLPGPTPTLPELRAWLVELAEFLENEKAVLSVLNEITAHSPEIPSFIAATRDVLMRSLGRHAPAFATAARDGAAAPEARARAELLLLEIVWAASELQKQSNIADMAVTIVVQALYDFLRDERFHAENDDGASIRTS